MTIEQILGSGRPKSSAIAYQRHGAGEFFVARRSPRLFLFCVRAGRRDYSLSLASADLAEALARWRLRPDGWQPLLPQQPLPQQRGAER